MHSPADTTLAPGTTVNQYAQGSVVGISTKVGTLVNVGVFTWVRCFCAWLAIATLVWIPRPAVAQDPMPSTPHEATVWLEEARNTVQKNEVGEVTEIIIDYVPDVFVVGDLDIFPKLEVLKINYTGEFLDRHMSGIARLTSLKEFNVDYCDEISEASISVLRYLPNLEVITLNDCESIYSLKSLDGCRSLKKIDLGSNQHLDFHALRSLIPLPKLESLVLNDNSTLEDKHLRWIGQMPKLTEIRMSNCSSVTEEGILHLARLKNLKVLDFSDNPDLTVKRLARWRDRRLKSCTSTIVELRTTHS